MKDLIALVGIGLFGYGLYLAWEPLAYIFVGLSLIGYGFTAAIVKATKKEK